MLAKTETDAFDASIANAFPFSVKHPLEKRFGRVRWNELDKPGKEHEYLIDKWLPVGEKSVLAGPSTSGKSFVAIALGMSIATDRDFYGYAVKKPGLVIFQAGEGRGGLKKRLRAYRNEHGIEPNDRVPFELLMQKVDLFGESDVGPFIEVCKRISEDYLEPLRIIFIDTLAVASIGFGADENSGRDMGQVLNNIDRIQNELQCAVCLVHHLNGAGTKLRGHTSIFANLETVIQVSFDTATKLRTVFLPKQKDDTTDGVQLQFRLKDVAAGRIGTDTTTSAVMEIVSGPEAGSEPLAKGLTRDGRLVLNDRDRDAFRALHSALQRKGRAPPEHVRAPIDAICITLTDWREELERVIVKESEDPVKLTHRAKKTRDKARQHFELMHLIEKDTEWLWRTQRRVAGFDPEIFIDPSILDEKHGAAPVDDFDF